MIGSCGMKKKHQLHPMGFAKTFAKKLNDAASSKGNAEMFMHQNHHKKVIDWHEDNRAKVTITVTSEGSKDQLMKGQKT